MKILSRQLEEGIIDETQYMKFGEIKYEYEYRKLNMNMSIETLHQQ
jgi:hypothetical protein